MSVYNAAKPSNESADAYLRFRPYLDNTHKKNLDYFFHKLAKRVTSKSGRAEKKGPTCCPTARSIRINPRLDVSVKHEAPIFRQFWIISAVLQSPEVETLENFFLFWRKLGPPNFRH